MPINETTRMIQRLAAVIAIAAFVAACSSFSPYNATDRALLGGAVGAGTGAVIGAQTGNPAAGAAIGGVAGATIGAATTPRPYYRRYNSNYQ